MKHGQGKRRLREVSVVPPGVHRNRAKGRVQAWGHFQLGSIVGVLLWKASAGGDVMVSGAGDPARFSYLKEENDEFCKRFHSHHHPIQSSHGSFGQDLVY